jgi:hypothetical protein
MNTITVVMEVPISIEVGLKTGTLERVGSVIRHTHDKQVVAWLREGGQTLQNPNTTNGLLASLMRSAGMNNHTVTVVLSRTMGTVNLAISAYTLHMMIQRVQQLEAQIENLYDRLEAEFARERRVSLVSALQHARDVVDAENDGYKQKVASDAIKELGKARQHLLADFQNALADTSPENLLQAQGALVQAMQLDTMRVRCYLETDQHQLAKKRLAEWIEEYQALAQRLVNLWLGENRAVYFHPSVDDDNLVRYVALEQKLRAKADVLLDLVLEHRQKFWDKKYEPTVNKFDIRSTMERLTRRDAPDEDITPTHLLALEQAELLFENLERLFGFQLELASLNLAFTEWEAYTPDIQDHDDFVMLVDKEALARLSL